MPWHESMTNCHHIEHKLKSKMFSEAFSFFFFGGGGGGKFRFTLSSNAIAVSMHSVIKLVLYMRINCGLVSKMQLAIHGKKL